MVTQLGLSPTSTLADVRTVLQNAIAQEEAAISGAQERLDVYQQQLASLASLVSLSAAPTNGATNGSAATTAETNGASSAAAPTVASSVTTDATTPVTAPPRRTGGKPKAKSSASKGSTAKSIPKVAASQPQAQVNAEPVATVEATPAALEVSPPAPPKRTGGKPKAKSTAAKGDTAKSTPKATGTKSTPKATASQPQAQVNAEPAATAAPVATVEATPATLEAAATAEVLADIPRVLKRFRGLSIPEAILVVLEEQPGKSLTSKEITKSLYGAAQVKDAAVEKKLIRVVSNNLTHGLKREVWQRVGEDPSLYQALPVS